MDLSRFDNVKQKKWHIDRDILMNSRCCGVRKFSPYDFFHSNVIPEGVGREAKQK